MEEIDTLATQKSWAQGSLQKPFTSIVTLYMHEQLSLEQAVREITGVINNVYYGNGDVGKFNFCIHVFHPIPSHPISSYPISSYHYYIYTMLTNYTQKSRGLPPGPLAHNPSHLQKAASPDHLASRPAHSVAVAPPDPSFDPAPTTQPHPTPADRHPEPHPR